MNLYKIKKIAFIKRTPIQIKKPLALQKRNKKIDKTEWYKNGSCIFHQENQSQRSTHIVCENGS